MRFLRITTFLSLVLLAFSNTGNAQNWVSDSTTMGASYAKDVFYSIENGFIKEEPSNNWDLAFRIGSRNDGIRINSYNNSSPTQLRTTKLFINPNATIADWATFDTTGWQGWQELYNDETNWELGAFNVSATGFPDFSWGVYDLNTKIVSGDSLYLVVVNDAGTNRLFKLWIINKDFGNWNFKYASFDGSNEQTVQIKSSDYATKNFAYFSFGGSSAAGVIDREPANTSWDLLFTRYAALQSGVNTYYPVMGVLNNIPVKIAEARGIGAEDADWADYDDKLDTFANVIGADWKTFNNGTFQWEFDDSLSFFVQLTNGAVYQMQFTGFTGASTAKSVFAKRKVQNGTGIFNAATLAAGIYPNPATDLINITMPNGSAIERLEIFSINGALQSSTIKLDNQVDVSALPQGVYVIKLTDAEGNSAVARFVK